MAEPVRLDIRPDTRADVVLVAGPARAGVTSVADRLRERMPDRRFAELAELAPGQAPVAVVWVVSATAPMTPAECVAAATVSAGTDAVVAVVNKTDDHRAWRHVLAVDTTRMPAATWVTAAAAPRLGPPRVDELTAALTAQLADPTLTRRNSARARDAERAAQARARHQLQQLRLELQSTVRQRCIAARAELTDEVSAMRGRRQVEGRVRAHCAQVRADVEAQLARGVAELTPAQAPAPLPPGRPPMPLPAGRRLDTQLMAVLGVGFGVGVALVVARLTATLAVGAGWASAAGGVAGIALSTWVVRARALLHHRARWERWVGDVVAALRIELEDSVAGRLLALDAAQSAAAWAGRDGFRGYRSVAGCPGPTVSSSESFL
ncbi:hypothetical protein GR927_14435 [Mycolicibacterium sp. 3033]|nr:hypothetical protein [Mycolicibacterium aurantiacum]